MKKWSVSVISTAHQVLFERELEGNIDYDNVMIYIKMLFGKYYFNQILDESKSDVRCLKNKLDLQVEGDYLITCGGANCITVTARLN